MSEIQTIDIDDYSESSNLDGGLIYYTAEYGKFLRSLLGAQSNYLIVGDPRRPSALFPMLIKSGPLGTVVNALPFFGSHGAPAVAPDSCVKAIDLLLSVETMISDFGWDSITIVENPLDPLSDTDIQKLRVLQPVDTRVSQMTYFSGEPVSSLEGLLSSFHSKTRNSIRKGLTTGQHVTTSNADAHWDFLIEEHQRSMSALNGTPKSRETFELIRQNLGEKVRLHCGFIGNDIASALVTIRHKQTVEYFTPVSSIAYRHQQVLPHLVAEVMLLDSQSGATRWNWGGTWESQHGVKHFKSRFGTTDRPYRYFHWSNKRVSEAPAEQILKEYPYWYVRRF